MSAPIDIQAAYEARVFCPSGAAVQRVESYLRATTVDALIDLLPSPYRAVLQEKIRDIARRQRRLLNHQCRLQSLLSDHGQGTVPPDLRVEYPPIRLDPLYEATAEGQELLRSWVLSREEYGLAVMQQHIDVCRVEISLISNRLRTQAVVQELVDELSLASLADDLNELLADLGLITMRAQVLGCS